MFRKTAAITALALAIGTTSAWAEFKETEKPVWGMLHETAYTLQGGEWNIDLWGPVTYGVIDNLQVGTMFWVWFAQVPNINAKWTLLPESEAFPAIGVSGSFYNFSLNLEDEDSNDSFKTSISIFGLAAHISKQLSQTLYLTGSYVYNGVQSSSTLSSEDNYILNYTGTNSSSSIVGSIVADMSRSARFSAEVAALLSDTVNFNAGVGFEWAMGDTFRLKLGVDGLIRDSLYYVPFIDLHWRFK